MEKLNLKINNGCVLNGPVQCFGLSVNNYLFFMNYLYKNFPTEMILDVYQKTSYDDIHIIYNSVYDENVNEITNLNNFLKQFNHLGLGEIELRLCKKGRIEIICKNTQLTKKYNNLFNEKHKCIIELLFTGVIKNLFSCHYKKKINIKSIIKKTHVVFEIEVLDEDFILISNKKYVDFEIDNISIEVKNMLLTNKIKYQRGCVVLGGMREIFFPLFSHFSAIEGIGHDENFRKFYYNQGFITGISYINVQLNFEQKIGDEVFNHFMKIFDFTGNGKFKFIENKKIVIENYLFDTLKKNYSDIVLEIHFNYLTQVFRGMYFKSYGEDIKIVQTSQFEFEFYEISDKVIFTKEDEFMIENLKYKNSLFK